MLPMINHSSRKVSRTRFYFSLSRPYSYSKVLDLLVRNCVFLKIHILLFRNKHGKKERQRSSIYQSIGLHAFAFRVSRYFANSSWNSSSVSVRQVNAFIITIITSPIFSLNLQCQLPSIPYPETVIRRPRS